MSLYEQLLRSSSYLKTVEKIDDIKFISNGKWDWDHGLNHYKRVAQYVKLILVQLGANERMIDLAMTAALLHDIGLCNGKKQNHAFASSKIFSFFLSDMNISLDEIEVLKQAILDHSNGAQIQSLVGMALVLADKLDVTYHRTINSSIKDDMNLEILKIKKVDIIINRYQLIVQYTTDVDFNEGILSYWPKAITIPLKVSQYLNKEYIFLINGSKVDYHTFLTISDN